MGRLEGAIAVVTGASRGIGKGIAHELGIEGAVVYVTGRTREGEASVDGASGSIDETARLVDEAGGTGVPARLDHTEDAAVAELADRIQEDHGRVDLLVNNVWGGYEHYDPAAWQVDLWEQPVSRWDKMFDVGVRAHYTTSRALAPLIIQDGGLIVNISVGDDGKYLGDVPYDVSKHSITRLGVALDHALQEQGVRAMTIWPGFTRTERVLDAFGIEPREWRSVDELDGSHSPRFVGRCVVALATDPELAQRGGGAFKAGDLGLSYGFTDVDGHQPQPFMIGA